MQRDYINYMHMLSDFVKEYSKKLMENSFKNIDFMQKLWNLCIIYPIMHVSVNFCVGQQQVWLFVPREYWGVMFTEQIISGNSSWQSPVANFEIMNEICVVHILATNGCLRRLQNSFSLWPESRPGSGSASMCLLNR